MRKEYSFLISTLERLQKMGIHFHYFLINDTTLTSLRPEYFRFSGALLRVYLWPKTQTKFLAINKKPPTAARVLHELFVRRFLLLFCQKIASCKNSAKAKDSVCARLTRSDRNCFCFSTLKHGIYLMDLMIWVSICDSLKPCPILSEM